MKNSNVKFHIARPRGIFAAFVLASAMGSAPGQALTAPAPPDDCFSSADVALQTLVSHSADYCSYRKNKVARGR
jgi:hypothetical protein